MRKQLGLIRPDNNTYRLIHGEGDFLPGLIVDVYAGTAVVQAHSVGMHRARHEITKALQAIEGIRNIYYKSDDTLPFKAKMEGEKQGQKNTLKALKMLRCPKNGQQELKK